MSDERFSGDMSRNEVELDLNKFMAMVTEIGELKAKIMELENDKEPENPWQRWIWLSGMIDAWRIFPRMFLTVYIVLLYKCTIWFMELTSTNIRAVWFNQYCGRSGCGMVRLVCWNGKR